MKNLLSILLATILCLLFGASDSLAQNIAKGKTARQSSTAYEGEAARALDGNTSGIWSQKSVTHTDSHKDPNQWWEVDLGQVYDIASIKIYNRTDCCMDRLRDIYILVSETPIQSNDWAKQPISTYYAYHEEFYPGQANPIVHQKEARGRYVRIYRQQGAALSLAEVEVYKSQNTVKEQVPPIAPYTGDLNYTEKEDQAQVKSSGTFFSGDVWQSFTAGKTGYLTKVMAYHYNSKESGTLYLYEGEGLRGKLLHQQAYTANGTSFLSFKINTPFIVQAGKKYTLRFSKFRWFLKGANVYKGGRAGKNSSYDHIFKTFISTPKTSKEKAEEEAKKKAEEEKIRLAIEANKKANEDLERFRAGQLRWHEQIRQAEEEEKRKAEEEKRKADAASYASDGIFKYDGGNLHLTIKKGQNEIFVKASSYYPTSLTYKQDINTPNRFIASYMRTKYVITFTSRNTLSLNSVKFYRNDPLSQPVALNIVMPQYFKVDGNDIKKELKDVAMGHRKDYVRFSLAVSNKVDGWKAIKVFDKNGNQISLIERDGNERTSSKSYPFPTSRFGTQVRVEFHKAKMFGVHTYITTKYFYLSEIKGKELAFTWLDE